VTDLVLICEYESATSSASVVRQLTLHSWTLKSLTNDECQTTVHGSLSRMSLSYDTTDGQSASLSWNKAPICCLWPDFYYCQTVAGLLMWSDLSDERTGVSFTITDSPRQGCHFRVQVLWDIRLYFTVSDSRPPFSSPPTTRWVTVEIFDPASTRVEWIGLTLLWLRGEPNVSHYVLQFLCYSVIPNRGNMR
jgi:hypothetical protein